MTVQALFFNGIFDGDPGKAWLPNFVNLAVVAPQPTITGRVYKLNAAISFFSLKIIPGTNTSSTAGTSYIDNFPLKMNADGICFAVTGQLGSNSGMCEQASNRIYLPAWSAVTVPLSVIGIVEAA